MEKRANWKRRLEIHIDSFHEALLDAIIAAWKMNLPPSLAAGVEAWISSSLEGCATQALPPKLLADLRASYGVPDVLRGGGGTGGT